MNYDTEQHKDTSLFEGIGVAIPTHKQPQVIVGSPQDFPDLTQLTDSKGKKLNTSQKYLGADFELEMDFSSTKANKDLFKDVVSTVNEATDKVYELRLKSISKTGLTKDEKNLLDIKNSYISEIYTARDQGNLTEQVQIEAEARMVEQEADLYLSVESVDTTTLKSIYSKLKALIVKLGAKATPSMYVTLNKIEAKLKVESTKNQANSQVSN